jgi:aspartate ammonia-lyase
LALILNHLEPLLDFNMNEVLEIYKRYDMLVGKDIIVMPKKKEDPTRQEVRVPATLTCAITKHVRFTNKTVVARQAKAIGFTEEGLLEALFADGQVRALLAEEVSIRPSNM